MGNSVGSSSSEGSSSSSPKPPPGITQLNEYVWELYRNKDASIDVDIVFFPGLQRDRLEDAFWKSFVARDDENTVWPKEWLSKIFPNARMLSISYYSSVRVLDTYRLGENLVQDIILGTKGIGQNRPVFLVGHSLGGLVIKQLFLSALNKKGLAAEGEVSRIDKFIRNIRGIFYYATPHGGTRIASTAKELRNPRHPNTILGLLKVLDTKAGRINEAFRKQLVRFKIPAVTVTETSDTDYLGFKTEVVEEASATMNVDSSFMHPDADHFTVCQARHAADPVVIEKLALFIHGHEPPDTKIEYIALDSEDRDGVQ